MFPIAGKGERFGYTFKPFLEIEDEGSFIELAFEPFKKYLSHIEEIVFIFLEEQEKKYDVSSKLKKLFIDVKFSTCILKEETKGPAETIRLAINKKNINGQILICDCDHTLNVDSIFAKIKEDNSDCIVPIWSLRDESIKSWSIVSINENDNVTGIAEKELPNSSGQFYGVIGCYYIRDSNILLNNKYTNISDCIKDIIDNNNNNRIIAVKIIEARFFGNPQRLENSLQKNKKPSGTIFCDLDGTIIFHEDSPSTLGIEILEGAKIKLKEWKSINYYIILTTARSSINREYLLTELARHNIIYDELIMGLPSGPRIIINDRKPSDFLNPTALAYEVKRNQGINNIDIRIPEVKVIERMKGGSFSDTLLIEREGKKYIRKIASKRENLELGYFRLKKQYMQLLRFKSFYDSIVPNLIREEDNTYEYYFDMEYLEGYFLLSECDTNLKIKAVESLLEKLSKKIYIQTALLKSGRSWLSQHLSAKIYNKLKAENYDGKISQILKHERLTINEKNYPNIKFIIDDLYNDYGEELSPNFLCPVHGDLTFENILCQEVFGLDVKVIDMDGAEYIDAVELDMGKMFQSILTKYETWSKSKIPLVNSRKDGINLAFNLNVDTNEISKYVDLWLEVLHEPKRIVMAKCYFYTALHMIRMIRFRLKVSEDQALYALVIATLLLSEACLILREK